MGERYYTKPGQDRLYPSVTTILSATMGGDRTLRIIDALQKPSGLKRRELSRQRGNELDRLVKDYLTDKPMTCASSEYMVYFRKLIPALAEIKATSDEIICDTPVFNDELGYAGTPDIILIRRATACVVDVKSSVSRQLFTYAKGDAWLQVVAYGMALESSCPVSAYGILLATKSWGGFELLTDPCQIESFRHEWFERLRMFGISASDSGGNSYDSYDSYDLNDEVFSCEVMEPLDL